jgi:hypothetical protein
VEPVAGGISRRFSIVTRYLPIVLAIALIVGLTIPQIRMTDRLSGTNISAEQRAELLKLVPKDFGDWHGEDKPVDPNVQKTAGATGAVSRDYRNSRTGERVDLWLIVGHSRDVSFHTPDVCYRGAGFEARGKENSLYPLVMPGMPETPMWTNTFFKEDATGRHLLRVFWTWYNPESPVNSSQVAWEAPPNPRWHFGNARALYKMYFTSEMRDQMETAEQSACLRFAKDFLPEVDKALSAVYGKLDPAGSANASAKQPAAPADAAPSAAAASEPSATPKTEPEAADKNAVVPADQQPAIAPAETAETPKAE